MTTPQLVNLIQRLIGLTAFTLFFFQLIFGAFMDKWVKKLGGWVFKLHVINGILIYILAFVHPLVFMFFNHLIGGKLDPYAVFVNACLICQYPTNYYYTLGIVSFWLLTLSTFAAIFRNYNSWFKTNWRKFHVLNYIIFLIIGAHGFLLGTDFSVKPFVFFAIPAYLIIVGIIVFVEIPRLYKNFRSWLDAS